MDRASIQTLWRRGCWTQWPSACARSVHRSVESNSAWIICAHARGVWSAQSPKFRVRLYPFSHTHGHSRLVRRVRSTSDYRLSAEFIRSAQCTKSLRASGEVRLRCDTIALMRHGSFPERSMARPSQSMSKRSWSLRSALRHRDHRQSWQSQGQSRPPAHSRRRRQALVPAEILTRPKSDRTGLCQAHPVSNSSSKTD